MRRFPRLFCSSLPAGTTSTHVQPQQAGGPEQASRQHRPWRSAIFSALLFTIAVTAAQAQKYTSIVVFGDSLSDVGNLADVTQMKYGFRVPGPVADYTDGRATDGFDTLPAARNFRGVWIEQLAALLPGNPSIRPSLEGGTDYAYGFAKTGSGLGVYTFGPGNALSVNVHNMGDQISEYLATKPKINEKTLFVVWGGAIDVLNAKSPKDVVTAAVDEAVDVQRLINAGATQFLVPNLPPLGAVPRLNGSLASSVAGTQASLLFNGTLGAGLTILRDFNPGRHVKISEVDVFGLFLRVISAPSRFGLTNVTSGAQGLFSVNPDTYLFWDDLHPTTRGHNILALTADQLLVPSRPREEIEGSEVEVGTH